MHAEDLSSRPTIVFIIVTRTSDASAACRVRVPFNFYAGGRPFHMGDYTIIRRHNGIDITGEGQLETQKVNVAVQKSGESAHGTLVFIEFGNHYLLSKAFWPDAVTGAELQ